MQGGQAVEFVKEVSMAKCAIAVSMVLALACMASCGERNASSNANASPGVVAGHGTTATQTQSDKEAVSTMKHDESGASAAGANGGAQEAMFGAGCFWGVEMTFAKTPGVLTTAVGYAGGKTDSPTYQQVCTDLTGHAEVVHLTYDPAKVSYQQLLKVFFDNHNPTQVNRQGPDYGTQYRSVIFTYGDGQKALAEAAKKSLGESGRFTQPIATSIEAAPKFWKAEEYHQRYLEKKGLDNCHIPSGS